MNNKLLYSRRPLLDYFDYFIGLYILVSTMIARLSISSLSSALIAAPNIFLIPYLVGASISNIFMKELRNKSISFRFLIGFFVGTLFVFSSSTLIAFFGNTINMPLFDGILILTMLIAFFGDLVFRLRENQCIRAGFLKSLKLPKFGVDSIFSLVTPFLIAVLAFYIPKIEVPFPMVSLDGGVVHEILQPVNRLLTDGVLNVYQTRGLPVVLVSTVCSLSNISVLNFDWAAPFATCLVFAFSMFSLSYKVGKYRIIALSATLFAFFLNSSGIFFDVTDYIFRYSTIIAAIFPLVLQEVYLNFIEAKKEYPNTRNKLFLPFIGTLIAIAVLWAFEFLKPAFFVSIFHVNEFLRPFVDIVFLVVSLIYIQKLNNPKLKALALVLALFTPFAISLDILRPVLFVLFLYFFIFALDQIEKGKSSSRGIISNDNSINRLPIWSHGLNILRAISILIALYAFLIITGILNTGVFSPFNIAISTTTKLSSLITSDSIGVLVLSILFGVLLVFSSSIEEIAFGFSFLVSLFLYFLPISEMYYVAYLFLNVFMAFTISAGAFRIAQVIRKYLVTLGRRVSIIRSKYLGRISVIGYLLLIFLILIPVVSACIYRFTWTPEGSTHASLLADYELSAATDYLSKTGEDTRIISDPFTMIYLSPYINHVALIGDAMPPFSAQSESVIDMVWQNVFHGNSSSEIYSNITSLDNVIPASDAYYLQHGHQGYNLTRYVVVVSARTAWWLDYGDPYGYYPLFPETYGVTFSQVARFFDPRYFTPVYQIDGEIYIFLVGETNTTLSPVSNGNVLSLSLTGGNYSVVDRSGFGNNLTAHGTTLVNVAGNYALGFNGLDSYVEVADSPSLHLSPSFSIEFSFCPTVNKSWMAIYKGDMAADNSWYVYGDSTSTIVARYWFNGTAYGAEYSYNLLNKWTYIAIVYQGEGKPILMYVNGILVASGDMPSGASYNTQKLWVGHYEIPNYNLAGLVGEVRIYNQTLSQEEIYNNYLYESDQFRAR